MRRLWSVSTHRRPKRPGHAAHETAHARGPTRVDPAANNAVPPRTTSRITATRRAQETLRPRPLSYCQDEARALAAGPAASAVVTTPHATGCYASCRAGVRAFCRAAVVPPRHGPCVATMPLASLAVLTLRRYATRPWPIGPSCRRAALTRGCFYPATTTAAAATAVVVSAAGMATATAASNHSNQHNVYDQVHHASGNHPRHQQRLSRIFDWPRPRN